jgi:glycosyltransferase involved in cell wall biosynthesis
MVRSLNLEEYVHLHQAVPWDQLASKLERMDVGIVANRVNVATELMLPSKLIDYVVLGIPAIVPRLRAIQYYFSDEMVAFFKPEDIDSMVAATVELYRNKTRRSRQAECAKEFLRRHGWERGELRKLYQQLIPSVENEEHAGYLENETPAEATVGVKDNQLNEN